MRTSLPLQVVASATLLSSFSSAQDWANLGGNSSVNGLTDVVGPAQADQAWIVNENSLISWAPFISDGRVFTVRQTNFPQDNGNANDEIVALDLATGQELWRESLPFGGDTETEWICWIAGARDGQLYASRSSNLQPQPLLAFDAATGAFLWSSEISTESFAYEGMVFASNGDLVLADRNYITRIDPTDGSTIWSVDRLCPVSGACGVAVTDSAIFYDSPSLTTSFSIEVVKIDPATGSTLAISDPIGDWLAQNSPFLSPDGSRVYYTRAANTPTDALFAYDTDTLELLWSRQVRWTTSHRAGMAPDGSIYTFLPGNEFVRLDGETGDVLNTAGVLGPMGTNLSPYTVVDGAGRVYVSNGFANNPLGNGRVWAFSGDLAQSLFTLNLVRPNQGGPALGQSGPGEDGTLVICDLDKIVAYRSSASGPVGTPYCSSSATSLGSESLISAEGSVDLADQDLSLRASSVPDQPGIFFFGATADQLPFGNGTLCVGGTLVRLPVEVASGGVLQHTVDFASVGGAALSAGTTRFQAWFRDPDAGGAAFNLSDGLSVELQ